jgi:hypothetical protein
MDKDPKELGDCVICCRSLEEFNQLMEWAEGNGYLWCNKKKPTVNRNYKADYERFGVFLSRDGLEYSRVEWYEEDGSYGPIVEFQDFYSAQIDDGLTGIEF